jgi:hypothetical protein
LRGDLEKLRQDALELWRLREPQARSYVITYNPDEPRVPAGNPAGGQWMNDAETALLKASPDNSKHPGWPAGTAGGLGGKFRPKDGHEDDKSGSSADIDVHSIIATARRLNIATASNAYQTCLSLCYPFLKDFNRREATATRGTSISV